MSKLRVISTNTPDGDFHLIVDERDTVCASGFGSSNELQKRLPEELRAVAPEAVKEHSYQKLVQAYYDGDVVALDKIPRTQDGTDFQKKVWRAINSIGYGKTMSYKELAEKSGNSAAIRAVGTICGLNRLILLVPCHRVLKSDGGIGSYLYGSAIKEALLSREGAL